METLIELLPEAAAGGFLIPCVISDVRRRGISLRYLIIALFLSVAAGLIQCLAGERSLSEIFPAMLPGMLLLCTAGLTGGKIGAGDGLVFLVIGILIGCRGAFVVMLAALLLSAVWSIYLLIRKKVKRDSAIPWMPFVLGGYAIRLISMAL